MENKLFLQVLHIVLFVLGDYMKSFLMPLFNFNYDYFNRPVVSLRDQKPPQK